MNGNKYFHIQSDKLFIISYIHAILFRQGGASLCFGQTETLLCEAKNIPSVSFENLMYQP